MSCYCTYWLTVNPCSRCDFPALSNHAWQKLVVFESTKGDSESDTTLFGKPVYWLCYELW